MTKSDDLISIIMPVYNVEKYLPKCIESVMKQTYQNLEIILVDDGSKDDSGRICDDYARIDKRIKVLHKANGGLSDARNAGIAIASGQYIGFIDSDDYIDADMYQTLYEDIQVASVDLSICGYYHTYPNHEIPSYSKEEKFISDDVMAMKIFLEGKLSAIMCWNKLYKQSAFRDLRFPVGKTMEDTFIIVELISQCKKVVFNTVPKYHYIHRKESITNASFSEKTFDIIEAYEHVYGMIEEYYPTLIDYAEARLIWAHFYVLDKLLLSSDRDRSLHCTELVYYLRKHWRKVLRGTLFNYKRKVGIIFLLINLNLYSGLVSIQNKKNIFR